MTAHIQVCLMRRCIAPEILVIQQPAEEINSTSTLDICTCAPKHALIFHLCDLHVSSVANGGQGTKYTYFIRYIYTKESSSVTLISKCENLHSHILQFILCNEIYRVKSVTQHIIFT